MEIIIGYNNSKLLYLYYYASPILNILNILNTDTSLFFSNILNNIQINGILFNYYLSFYFQTVLNTQQYTWFGEHKR